jgi:S-(hydroxymethyl)glutathione dehydrogenase/alcohol dehydrogenase
VNGAALAGAERIIAIDRLPSKLEMAKRMGATETLLAGNDDVAAQVREMTGGGVHYSFEALGLKETAEQSFAMLRPGGTATIIGMVPSARRSSCTASTSCGSGRSRAPPWAPTASAWTCRGCSGLWKQGRLHLDHLISGTLKLDEINEGFARLKSGEVVRQLVAFG